MNIIHKSPFFIFLSIFTAFNASSEYVLQNGQSVSASNISMSTAVLSMQGGFVSSSCSINIDGSVINSGYKDGVATNPNIGAMPVVGTYTLINAQSWVDSLSPRTYFNLNFTDCPIGNFSYAMFAKNTNNPINDYGYPSGPNGRAKNLALKLFDGDTSLINVGYFPFEITTAGGGYTVQIGMSYYLPPGVDAKSLVPGREGTYISLYVDYFPDSEK